MSGSGIEELLPQYYDELRRLAASHMANEPIGHTLTPTSLVHETFLRLKTEKYESKLEFFRAAALVMRRILVDHARAKRADKRGAGLRVEQHFDLVKQPTDEPDFEALTESLDRLAAVQPQVAELVQMRFFSGLTIPEAAELLGIAPRTADAWWAYARGWLAEDLKSRG